MSLHFTNYLLNLLLELLLGLLFKTHFGLQTKDEGHHGQQYYYSTNLYHFSTKSYAIFRVFFLILLFILLYLLFICVFLLYLIIQNLVVAFAVLHLPFPFYVTINFSESTSYSLNFTHSLELILFMKTNLLNICVTFLFKKLLVFFIDVDFDLWLCIIIKIVFLFSISLFSLFTFFSRDIFLIELCLWLYSNLLIISASVSLATKGFICFLYFLKPIFVCSLINIRMIYFCKF